MRTTYLLIAFIAAAALFFYFAGNFSQTGNPFVSGNTSSTSNTSRSNLGPTVNQPGIRNSTSLAPSGFQGPIGKPGAGFIGPNGPPPNY
ncbi:MAG: hypothetical protein Q7K44_00705 [Candidatus Liptonbacteria bacterium]|nr:hypothetical protein [Candidatus Liptonbacteria bacterium]